ncbi:MAG TPA: hypothetical protein DCK95_05770 [Anaerolineaceae bacterium]|uniref:UDP-N-acetylenolpyruvoylglucosamine reductase n=1 Tax=Anaerolinea thermophila TaxID=167964 RepID=A0A117LH54_9CHLR|nr:MAG: UDP-N-acetylenolpyruvoylglucosamine reductase [Anaerolinea thermophila]HAF61815.1 hypothetical protein [Anaerolineaceae bacterium]
MSDQAMNALREKFPNRLQENVLMRNYTTIHAGGKADALLIAQDAVELEHFVRQVWELNLPLLVLGSGSNILISDKGVRGVVIINHAHNIQIHQQQERYEVHAEAGALMGKAAKLAINRHLSGLEWAATLPGTVGGAVYGNAGCFGKETADNFLRAEILHRNNGKTIFSKEEMAFEYRSSILKRNLVECVLLSAWFSVIPGDYEQSMQQVETYHERRLENQPFGPSMGSIFRNPQGDKAGRMIEMVGLKGKKIGGAEISAQHGNFILNSSDGSAQDIWELIQLIETHVCQQFGIYLHPEIQLIGDWDENIMKQFDTYQTVQEHA